jgi:hypothetical protein
MATYRAVEAACEAVVYLLRQSWQPALFANTELQFAVFRTINFKEPMKAGVSLFLYRVMVNCVQRTPAARARSGGGSRKTQLPLDLHFLLTPWATEASLEQDILGWMMRIIEDTPVLPSGLLNTTPDVFSEEETVEIMPGQLTNEEMFRIWDVLPQSYQISIPYIARVVRIDSEVVDQNEAGPVLTKELDFGVWRNT